MIPGFTLRSDKSDAHLDQDNDGITNINEWIFGTAVSTPKTFAGPRWCSAGVVTK